MSISGVHHEPDGSVEAGVRTEKRAAEMVPGREHRVANGHQ